MDETTLAESNVLPPNVATIKKEYCFTFLRNIADNDYSCRVRMTDYFGLITAQGVENLEKRNGDAFLVHQVDTLDKLYEKLIVDYPAPLFVILHRGKNNFT